MRKIISTLTLAATTAFSGAILFPGAPAFAEEHATKCSSATIEGDYSFRISGYLFTPAGVVARDGIALTHFDGHSTLWQADYVLADGASAPAPKNANGFHDQETGTYTVHDDCTGEAEIDFPTPPGGSSGAVIKLLFVISDDGRQLNTIVTSLTPPDSTHAIPANIHSDATRVRH